MKCGVTDLLFLFEFGACNVGGLSVRTYAYDKCNIDLVQGQYRAEYLP